MNISVITKGREDQRSLIGKKRSQRKLIELMRMLGWIGGGVLTRKHEWLSVMCLELGFRMCLLKEASEWKCV